MNTTASSSLASEYEANGFVVVPDLLTGDECDQLKVEARKVLAEKAKPGASVFVHVAVASEAFRVLSEDPRVVGILRQIMPDGVMFLSDKLVYKAPDKTFPTPWHIDCFYWRNTRPKLSVWIPLDDATAENGTLTVIAGSHQQDWRLVKKGLANGEFEHEIPDADLQRLEVTTCNIKRGTAVFFSDRLVHGSTSNTAGKDRYAIISTYHAPAPDDAFDVNYPARKVLVEN